KSFKQACEYILFPFASFGCTNPTRERGSNEKPSLTRRVSGRHSGVDVLQANDIQAAGDFFDGDQLALTPAGTDFAGVLPGLGRAQVALPERPGAALGWADLVDGAAGGFVVKHTIAVRLLAQAALPLDQARVHVPKFVRGHVKEFGDGGDLFLRHPDIAG